jgi:hypothetical protein
MMALAGYESKGLSYLCFFCQCFVLISFGPLATSVVDLIVSRIHMNDCPIQPKIPLFLCILGIANLIDSILLIMTLCCSAVSSIGSDGRIGVAYRAFVTLCMLGIFFQFIWLLLGSFWIFKIYRIVVHDAKIGLATYCHKTLYQVAFSMVIFNYISLIVKTSSIVQLCYRYLKMYQKVPT